MARPEQIAPEGDWDIWLALAGRGFGKTRLGAEWVREQGRIADNQIAVIAETVKDARQVVIPAIMQACPPGEQPRWHKRENKAIVYLTNPR